MIFPRKNISNSLEAVAGNNDETTAKLGQTAGNLNRGSREIGKCLLSLLYSVITAGSCTHRRHRCGARS